MTPYPYVIDLNSNVAEALAMMRAHHIKHLPVVKEGCAYGLVSEREINLVLSLNKGFRAVETILVKEACSLETYIVEMETPLEEVLSYMSRTHMGSCLVVKDKRVAGIFTSVDACHHFFKFLKTKYRTKKTK